VSVSRGKAFFFSDQRRGQPGAEALRRRRPCNGRRLDAEQAAARAGARFLGISLVDMAKEVDVGVRLEPAVGLALIGEPAFAQGVMAEHEHELALGKVPECAGEGLLAEAEFSLVEITDGEQGGVEADDAKAEAAAGDDRMRSEERIGGVLDAGEGGGQGAEEEGQSTGRRRGRSIADPVSGRGSPILQHDSPA
jgi:hypothetical protein